MVVEHIRKTAHKLSGSAGPDSMLWQSILLKHGNQSKELRKAMATLLQKGKRIAVLHGKKFELKR